MSIDLTTTEKANDYTALGFVPTEKELDIFNKEKMDMYKGTFIVCLVYGICAIGLICIIFLTDWGREYIYSKMLPAAITFIFGAIFIILFLTISIYDLKPRKVRNRIDKDSEIVCPDYWVLKRVDDDTKAQLIENNKYGSSGNGIIKSIRTKNDDKLKYKCEPDPNVYGDIKNYSEMKNNLYKDVGNLYKKGRTYNNRDTETSTDYLYVEKLDGTSAQIQNHIPYNNEKLATYAQFSGIYFSGDGTVGNASKAGTADSNMSKLQNNSLLVEGNRSNSEQAFYSSSMPLICNMVYPQVLAGFDKDTPEQNKFRCEYAKACDIAWTDIGCKYEPVKKTT